MTSAKVSRLLLLSILVMALAPLMAAFYLLEDALETSLNLGFNAPVVSALDDAAENLRTLGKLDPANRERYRNEFEAIGELKQVYADPALIKNSIEDSLKIYFGIGLGATLLLSIAIATLLSRRIAANYRAAFDELSRQRDKMRYLEEMASWQEMAKMLAHEIKNPLTPIEVLITSLSKSFMKKSADEFREQLAQTERMIGEELGHLKSTVIKFSEFARLPQVVLTTEALRPVLEQQVKAVASTLDADVQLTVESDATATRVAIDAALFRQVIANILRNGIEANTGHAVQFAITMTTENRCARIVIENDGAPVAHELASRIFDPYVSNKPGKQNMGLGLAIVKKIVIEHGGEVEYCERQCRPAFVISLPQVD